MMQTLPTWLVAALNDPYQLIPRIEWSPDWSTWFPLRPLSGSHSQNRTQQTRWQFSGDFAKDYTVGEGGLHPYGPRVRIYLGVKTVRQPVFWMPQGYYSITSAEEDESRISLAGASFETDVQEADFVQTRRIPDRRFLSYRGQAENLISEAVPDARFWWDDRLNYGEPCPTAYIINGRWTLVDGRDSDASIMGALGGEAYCDATGGFRFVPTPTLDDPPVWRVAPGGALVQATRSFDRADVFNVVSAMGEATDGLTTAGPVYAWDNEPTSITFAGPDPVRRPGYKASRFGVKPFHYTSPLIKSEVQAGIAARAQLANKLGLHYSLALTARYHPGVEAGDVIEAETYDGRIERHLLDAVSYTWGAAEMTCEIRSPKEVFSSAASKRVNALIAVSDEIPLGTGGESSEEGTESPPPPDDGGTGQTRTISFTATGGRTFQQDGDLRMNDRLYQGRYDSTNGNQKSMVSFNWSSIQAKLSGKEVTGVSLRVRNQFSYYNSGMTGVIGTHNADTIGAWSSTNTDRKRRSFSKGGWETIDLGKTIAEEFRDNKSKGIVFGPGPSTSKTYYGYFDITGDQKPVLTFTYID